VPRRQFEQSLHRKDLAIIEVSDFVMPATVALVRSAMPGRFDVAIDLLAAELKSKLGTSKSRIKIIDIMHLIYLTRATTVEGSGLRMNLQVQLSARKAELHASEEVVCYDCDGFPHPA
jgi:hypothetical protein